MDVFEKRRMKKVELSLFKQLYEQIRHVIQHEIALPEFASD
jgi:predicted peroxiredoxin